jgi:thiol-disulfide isomerase/thioredoxin
MKSKVLFTIALSTLLFACTKTDPNLVTISGKITNPIGEDISFFNQDTTYSTTTNENDNFSISFLLDSATYINFGHGVEITAMYIKPGDKINLTIDTELFDETIQYKGSVESSFLAKKYLIEEENDFRGETYYMSTANEYKENLYQFKSALINEFGEITDSIFINHEIEDVDEMIDYFIKQQSKLSDYSKDVRKYMWETSKASRNYNFYSVIDSLNMEQFNIMLDDYSNEFLSLLSKVTDADFIVEAKEKIKKTTSSWREKKTDIDIMPKVGEAAIDFTYPDKDGNEFSLSSFRGNLVYVDVWATWCGPCRAEIPALQQLEKDYHDKNITFLSVSTDRDKDAWIKMVKEKELGGIQLLAGNNSKISKSYAIFGIPRFMLFDTEGNVISTDAPRPSSDEIRPLLDENL